jgi:hypothetical protein
MLNTIKHGRHLSFRLIMGIKDTRYQETCSLLRNILKIYEKKFIYYYNRNYETSLIYTYCDMTSEGLNSGPRVDVNCYCISVVL